MSPAALRGQAFAYSILLLGVGGLLSPLLAALGSAASYRVSLGALAATLLVGGAVLSRAAGTVQTDALVVEALVVEALVVAATADGSDPERPGRPTR